MPAFDERAKKVTRALVRLLQKAGVDFAILGNEEQCTGDPARRAGNEYLFQMFAQANIEVLNGYGVQDKKVITICPHCYNTLAHEYPRLRRQVPGVALHRGAGGFAGKAASSSWRGAMTRRWRITIPAILGATTRSTSSRGQPCGRCLVCSWSRRHNPAIAACAAARAGPQMFKEEEEGEAKVYVTRTEQLLAAGPETISTACPFCMRMLTDGLADKEKEDLPQLDIAEILLEALERPAPAPAE